MKEDVTHTRMNTATLAQIIHSLEYVLAEAKKRGAHNEVYRLEHTIRLIKEMLK